MPACGSRIAGLMTPRLGRTPDRSNRTGPHCDVVLLRRARRAASPAACQALLYCCVVPVVPGPAAVVALPAPTWFGLALALGLAFGLALGLALGLGLGLGLG